MHVILGGVPLSGIQLVTAQPYTVVIEEADLTVGVAQVVIVPAATLLAYRGVYIYLANISLGAQIIRIGFNPSFAPGRGVVLIPGAQIAAPYIGPLLACASAPGGNLNRFVMGIPA